MDDPKGGQKNKVIELVNDKGKFDHFFEIGSISDWIFL